MQLTHLIGLGRTFNHYPIKIDKIIAYLKSVKIYKFHLTSITLMKNLLHFEKLTFNLRADILLFFEIKCLQCRNALIKIRLGDLIFNCQSLHIRACYKSHE